MSKRNSMPSVVVSLMICALFYCERRGEHTVWRSNWSRERARYVTFTDAGRREHRHAPKFSATVNCTNFPHGIELAAAPARCDVRRHPQCFMAPPPMFTPPAADAH